MKHTPGPWLEVKGRFANAPSQIRAAGQLVAEVPVQDGSAFAECEANARLIAMAPTLLEVAKNSRKLLDGLLPLFAKLDELASTGYEPGMRQIIREIDWVVNRTEGK